MCLVGGKKTFFVEGKRAASECVSCDYYGPMVTKMKNSNPKKPARNKKLTNIHTKMK